MPLWTDRGYGWERVKMARADNALDAYLCCPGPSLAYLDRDLRGPGRTVYAVNTAYPKVVPDVWLGLYPPTCFDARLWHEPFMKVTRHWGAGRTGAAGGVWRGDNDGKRWMPNTFFASLEDASPMAMFTRRDDESYFIWDKNTFIFALHFIIWCGHKRVFLFGCDMGVGGAGPGNIQHPTSNTQHPIAGPQTPPPCEVELPATAVAALRADSVWPLAPLEFAAKGRSQVQLGNEKQGELRTPHTALRDYFDGRVLTEEQRANNKRLYDSLVEKMKTLAPMARRNGIEILSCTAGSPLNAFLPYVDGASAMASGERRLPPPGRLLHVFDAVEERRKPGARERHVVLVLKSGGDFRREHVERLVSQLPGCDVTLLTDIPEAVWAVRAGTEEAARKLRIVPLKCGWPGWWSKMELFSPELPGFRDKAFLYLDLDTTVRSVDDGFFTSLRSVVLSPFTHEEERTVGGLQTGVMWLHPAERAQVWERWREDPRRFMRWFRGDQEFVQSCGVLWQTWQQVLPEAVVSYKQNILRGMNYAGQPLDEAKVKIVAYHGQPRPWEGATDGGS